MMNALKNLKSFAVLMLICLSLTACFAGQSDRQNKYLLHIKMPAMQRHAITKESLEITRLKILPQFATNEFIYRTSDSGYLNDYYHIFMVPPDQQLYQITEKYLARKHIFDKQGGTLFSYTHPDYVLQGVVTALYADYRNSNRPMAIVAIRYAFVDNEKGRQKILFDKTFRAAVPLKAKTSQALVNAWGVGVGRVMATLSRDISGVIQE